MRVSGDAAREPSLHAGALPCAASALSRRIADFPLPVIGGHAQVPRRKNITWEKYRVPGDADRATLLLAMEERAEIAGRVSDILSGLGIQDAERETREKERK